MSESLISGAPEASHPTLAHGFDALGLCSELRGNVRTAGYTTPTPIQREAMPHVLDGRDVLGCAQTGTGKTAAFALPILEHLLQEDTAGDRRRRPIRALILAPTRELASQIHESFESYAGGSGLRSCVIFGGVGKNPQYQALRRGVDIVVATPGRLLDLMNEGVVDLGDVRTFVLDEADRMLDMGFVKDVRRIARAVPRERQTLLFSATMPREIEELAKSLLHDPIRLAVDPVSSTVEPIEQSVYFVDGKRKADLLRTLLEAGEVDRALVFTRTKHGANRLVQKLGRARIEAAAIHGNKSQSARESALRRFKTGQTRVVVATDIAARGIDVKGLSHVINYDLPNEPESYVHRIGRTGRAGESGVALSLCSPEERGYLSAIERLTRRRLDRLDTPEGLASLPDEPREPRRPRNGRSAGARDESRRGGSRATSGSTGQRSRRSRGARSEETGRKASPRGAGTSRTRSGRDERPSGDRESHRRPSSPSGSGRAGSTGSRRPRSGGRGRRGNGRA